MKFTYRHIILVAALYLSGAANGTMDALQFHGAHAKLDNAQFWNPAISWENKWARNEAGKVMVGKERFWGSSRWFVSVTDGWHLVKWIYLSFLTVSVLVAWSMGFTGKRYHYLVYFAVFKFIMAIGFHTTYTVLL